MRVFWLVLISALSFVFCAAENITWREVPWGASPLEVMKEVGQKEKAYVDPNDSNNVLVEWGYTMTALKFRDNKFYEAFSVIAIQPGDDWAPVLKDLVEEYSALFKMWPEKPSTSDLLAVLKNPKHQDVDWFMANVHNKLAIVWKDTNGGVMMMTVSYDTEDKFIRIRILMRGN